MSSFTSTASIPPPLLPTVPLFDRFGKPIKSVDPSKRLADEHRRKVRAARQAAELELIEWSQILHRKLLDRALDPKTDPKLATDISFRLIDRGIGKVREVESETAEDKRRSLDPNNILDVLAALSTQAMASQQQQRLERDVSSQTVTTDQQAIDLLEQIERERGQVIDHEEEDEND
ncbi:MULTISPECIES: hypothetical protein [Pseudomonas]|uniref:hypothetical protein n=1 Tax=Pseudomonas TaxID=286 RepID=UPI001AE84AD8|nr:MULTISPECIES: hypothetical protein [Pseudomonas]MBP2083525.1 hypothetical protein [Pseudomonas sp. PvP089]MBP2090772.1 hypothetical protein [Pseudomonas sp. PvP088]MBP2223064.1 hypothetical protein [Pseudomonas putida]